MCLEKTLLQTLWPFTVSDHFSLHWKQCDMPSFALPPLQSWIYFRNIFCKSFIFLFSCNGLDGWRQCSIKSKQWSIEGFKLLRSSTEAIVLSALLNNSNSSWQWEKSRRFNGIEDIILSINLLNSSEREIYDARGMPWWPDTIEYNWDNAPPRKKITTISRPKSLHQDRRNRARMWVWQKCWWCVVSERWQQCVSSDLLLLLLESTKPTLFSLVFQLRITIHMLATCTAFNWWCWS